MAADSSFDIVSKVDRQEVDNALGQAAREVSQRFDFKNTDSTITWSGEAIEIESNGEERAKAVLDVFQSKLVKRGVSLKALEAGEPRLSGKMWKTPAPPSRASPRRTRRRSPSWCATRAPRASSASSRATSCA